MILIVLTCNKKANVIHFHLFQKILVDIYIWNDYIFHIEVKSLIRWMIYKKWMLEKLLMK